MTSLLGRFMQASIVSADPPLHSRLFPPDVVALACDPDGEGGGALYPEEEAQVTRAVEKRKREYAAGRSLAREAMRRLGCPPSPIVNDADRVPAFPRGLVGSISHTKGRCVVALATSASYRAIGVDVEGAAPLDEKLFDTVLRPEERARIERLDERDRGRHAKLIFCIKECAYKAQYPEARRYFGFSGMSVEVQGDSFVATITLDAGPYRRGHRFEGLHGVEGPFVMAGLALPR